MRAHVRPTMRDQNDARFLREMLYEAAAWRPGYTRPFAEVLSDPALSRYVEGWGRAGDVGLIAEDEAGARVGAAWYRLFTDDEHGYGFLSPSIPEITIGVSRAVRGRGIGTTLLAALIECARQSGHPALSLSVEEDNPAVRLYERLGFLRVGQVANAWTMRLELSIAPRNRPE
jgi:[ribosomal protein S18]-alanine N-acetyltransferase